MIASPGLNFPALILLARLHFHEGRVLRAYPEELTLSERAETIFESVYYHQELEESSIPNL